MSIRLDTILTLGLLMLPFTALRVGVVGPGEALVAVFAFFLLLAGRFGPSRRIEGAEFSTFWGVFLVSVSLGALWNLISSEPTSTPSKTLFDLGSYVFIALALASMESARRAGILDVERVSFRWLVWSAVLVAGLFYVAQATPTLLGAPLFYFDKFVPWADNPHQITTSFIPLIFIGLHFLFTASSRGKRLIAFGAAIVLAICTIGTGAAKGALGVGLGVAYLIMAAVTRKVGLRLGLLFSVVLCTGVFSLFWVNEWWPIVRLAFTELDASGDRSFLYSAGIEVSDSIVGHGPGAHILMNGEFYDAHQSFLTAWLQGGVLGLVAFLLILYWLAKRLIGSPALFGGLIAILIYVAGGDVLRRMSVWVGLFAMVWLATGRVSRRPSFPESFDSRGARGRDT